MRHEFLSPVAIIYLLNAARGPLKDPRLRLALSLAVDREALITEVMGDGAAQPLRGFVSPHHYGAATTQGASCDRAEARALLAAAGYPDGLRLTVDCPTRLPDEAERLTAALARQLSEIGVTFDVRIHREREDYAHMVRRKEIGDLCVFDSSPMSTYRVLYEKIDSRIAGSWWQGYENPQVEALIDKGRSTTDRTKRSDIWQQAYRLLQNDPAWLTLYNPVRVIGLAGEHPDFQMPADGVIDVARLPALEGADT
ncbi:MAG: ABC transporter substrate-binding protein [Hoeflea sp.]|uniref:ABC transporter substrate-binding protein n=1 Tax=Hoeflea sp. TaxID=1940281 RepID=UPI003EF8A458